jgi:cyclophilin family peptidyl-prolyl cis-trans isomerase
MRQNLDPPSGDLDTSKTYSAVFTTEQGKFTAVLHADQAPLTVENFINLARAGYYDGTTFHRVIPGFMAQGGDPTGTGSGGPGYKFKDEFARGLSHNSEGVLSMANAGPNTNGSQFFITFVPTPHLNNRHSVFGKVVSGMDTVMNIRERDPGSDPRPGDKLVSVEIRES